MPLSAGARIGPYEVTAQIGAGGMGEVYRARDTQLGRDVAIKVLPDALARDTGRLSRFDREARTLAALNHPNIAAIYGLHEHDRTHVLVLELVQGKTLAERILPGPMPLGEALPIFGQVADGLLAAHRRGVIHRDLKPANIMIDTEGRVKLLDFGIAKTNWVDRSEDLLPQASRMYEGENDTRLEAQTKAPTSFPPTQEGNSQGGGVIIGTPSYMSPEQIAGREVDARTDIWAFGCCLFEALTARRAFGGEHFTAILQRVLRAEPEWLFLDTTPLAIRQLIRGCLAPDLDARPRDFAEVRSYLREPSVGLEQRLFDLSPDLLCVADFKGMFRRVNRAFERALGWRQEELEGRPFRELIHRDDLERTLAEFLRLQTTGQPTLSFENRYRCADGRFVRLQWVAQPEIETGMIYAVARLVDSAAAGSEESSRRYKV
jgi:eukaryotic-like serine/threonine-protein kinase